MRWKSASRSLLISLLSGMTVGGVLVGEVLRPSPGTAAEQLVTTVGDVTFSISLEELRTVVEEGTAPADWAPLLEQLNDRQWATLQRLLQQPLTVDAGALYRLSYTPMLEELFHQIGTVFETSVGNNGGMALRTGMILAAQDTGRFTLLDVLQYFPGSEVRVDLAALGALADTLALQVEYERAAVDAIAQEAATEATTTALPTGSDLRQPGPYGVTVETLAVAVEDVRPTQTGFASNYTMAVDLYLPDGLQQPAPLVVMTHGFGATRENYGYLARHLASQGFAVAAPEHIGSNLAYRQVFLEGDLDDILSPMEYVSRSLDITYLLDDLERRVAEDGELAQILDLTRVGVLGNSLGGTTALAVAGATLNQARLRQECLPDTVNLNPSYILQCPAKHLPPVNYNLADSRIQAVVAAYPLTRYIFGPEGMGTVDVPTLLISGSSDVITSPVQDQIHPFLWLGTPDRYLALLEGGTHFSSSEDRYVENFPAFLKGPQQAIGRSYLQALSTAFFQVYLHQDEAFRPYLSAAYGQTISQAAMPLALVQSLTPDQLATAYGASPPESVLPPLDVAFEPPRYPNLVEEIQASSTLKVAIRTDAPPLGYLDSEGQWSGYCFDLLDSFGTYLEGQLGLERDLNIVPLPSNLTNRFSLVQEGTVYLECGPNTIRTDVTGIQFSQPFFYTGTHLLTQATRSADFDPEATLEGVRLGVLQDTTTEAFIRDRYPNADLVFFDGAAGTLKGVQGVTDGSLDAFADDGLLLLGVGLQQGLPAENYALLPETPLTCDGYGLVLAGGDRQWQDLVNTFLRSRSARQVRDTWLSRFFPAELDILNACFSTAEP